VQMQDQGDDARPEWRAWGHPLGRRSAERSRAARADSAMAMDARHHRTDRRQVDMIIGVELALVLVGEPMVAMGACLGPRLHYSIGIFSQRARHAGPPLARRRPSLLATGLVTLASLDFSNLRGASGARI
jgi:hypothetical protein